MGIKQYLSDLKHMKKKTHCLKILRGILGGIPLIGSLLVEYSPEAEKENLIISKEEIANLRNFIKDYENKNEKGEKVWFSSDKRCYFLVNDKLCEQQGYVSIKSNDVYITFLHPFGNNNYFFSLEPSNSTINIIEKTNTYVHLNFSKSPKVNSLRWFVKGAIK